MTTQTTQQNISKRMTQLIVVLILEAAVLFIAAGRLDWTAAWIFLGVYLAALAFNAFFIVRKQPELVAERAQMAENVKGWDKILAPTVSLVMPLITMIVAGLDQRYGWSGVFPPAVQIMAILLFIAGYAMISWSMASNKFFSGFVRIQSERGHTVATSGPYHYVRHPGYLGMITFSLMTPLVLQSWVALIPGVITAALFIVRTTLEDKTLQTELPGYQAFTQQVRFRLIPGVW